MNEKIRTKLDSIKLLFLDVDNTALCLKMYDNNGENDKKNGSRIIGILDDTEWLEYNINNNAYIHCEAPRQIYNLVKYITNNGGRVYGLTECKNSFEYNSKFNRLKECYDGNFLHHGDLISIDTRHMKVKIMTAIAEKENIPIEDVMFIDDSFFEVMESHKVGILGMHTTEALMRFDDMNNIHTKGIGSPSNYKQ